MIRPPLPARYPPTGTWPAQMRADMTAAYLDYRDTAELQRAIVRGDAPPPSSLRGAGRGREPIWDRETLDQRIAPRAIGSHDGVDQKPNLAALV
jgi:hypothetical protein